MSHISWKRLLLFLLTGFLIAVELNTLWRLRNSAAWVDREAARSRMELGGWKAAAGAIKDPAAALFAARHEIAAMGAEFATQGTAASRKRATSVEAFIDISAFVERCRTRALAAGMALRPEERFGFSAYQHVGPEATMAVEVIRQREVIERVVETLIAARVPELFGIQREAPRGLADSATVRTASGAPAGRPGSTPAGRATADFFAIAPEFSLRRPERVNTIALRVSFGGDSAVLRRFLNALAEQGSGIAVRGVEVEVAAEQGRSTAARASVAGSDPLGREIIAPSRSRFTVTLEAIELEGRIAAAIQGGA